MSIVLMYCKKSRSFQRNNNTSVFSVIDTLDLLMCAQFVSKKKIKKTKFVLKQERFHSWYNDFLNFHCTFTKSYYGTFNEKLVKMRVLRGRKTRLYFLF